MNYQEQPVRPSKVKSVEQIALKKVNQKKKEMTPIASMQVSSNSPGNQKEKKENDKSPRHRHTEINKKHESTPMYGLLQ
jgi:hypothetical protein